MNIAEYIEKKLNNGLYPTYATKRKKLLWVDTEHIEYHFLDWFDGAEIILSGKDYEVMEKVKDYLTC